MGIIITNINFYHYLLADLLRVWTTQRFERSDSLTAWKNYSWHDVYSIIQSIVVHISGKVTCYRCKKTCKDQALKVGDRYFHVQCFTCKGLCQSDRVIRSARNYRCALQWRLWRYNTRGVTALYTTVYRENKVIYSKPSLWLINQLVQSWKIFICEGAMCNFSFRFVWRTRYGSAVYI